MKFQKSKLKQFDGDVIGSVFLGSIDCTLFRYTISHSKWPRNQCHLLLMD